MARQHTALTKKKKKKKKIFSELYIFEIVSEESENNAAIQKRQKLWSTKLHEFSVFHNVLKEYFRILLKYNLLCNKKAPVFRKVPSLLLFLPMHGSQQKLTSNKHHL